MTKNTIKRKVSATGGKINKKRQPEAVKKSPMATFFGNRALFLVGLTLVGLGLFLGGYSFINSWLSQRGASAYALQDNPIVKNEAPLISGEPVLIDLPSVGISLPVIPGEYNPASKSWTLTKDKAQWGTITAKLNNKADATFIYAHNRKNVFYTLPKIKAGEEAIVTAGNGYKFSYKFVGSHITKPEDTSIFSYRGKPVLVLQTCTGVWYQDRQLFIFDFQKASKPPA